MMTSPFSPPGAQREQPLKRWSRSKAIDGRSRTALKPRKTSSGSITMRADPGMAGTSCVLGDARLRHDRRDPTSRQSATAQKNETAPPGKSQSIITPPLIRWSIQEIRRIAIRLARKRIQPARIIAWSFWRRAHQDAAQRAHFKSKKQL